MLLDDPILPDEPALCPPWVELLELPLWLGSGDALDCANPRVAATSKAAQLNNNFFIDTPDVSRGVG
jgi:hypothetical protein